LEIDDVQSLWNRIETIMVDTTDELVPIRSFQNNVSTQSQTLPEVMKRKLALRKRLLNSMKRNPDDELKKRLKQLNAEIKNHY
jgi:flagellar basal body-associated protein FliL